MSDERERRNLILGQKKIDALAFGFFKLPVNADDEDYPPRPATAMSSSGLTERPDLSPRAHTYQSTSDDVVMASEYDEDSDPTIQRIMVYPGGPGAEVQFLATLDTGTPSNWISDSTLQQLQLQQGQLEAAVDYLTIDGKTISSTEVVDLRWYSVPGRKTRYTRFRVIEKAPFDIILGSDLIFQEGILTRNKLAWVMAKKPTTRGTGC
ncbi:uncharacterized protein PAC_16979 [Phialocephala subalpina]|uniref:Peptidase A2 domain-containing protein n=1 Tax=Phialocephala subalpina TaxID=576137 RepID=A0A1L7XPW7_9HELO|nr:uncharacterized protein PAC_16979 [Phialocephala subalpina]